MQIIVVGGIVTKNQRTFVDNLKQTNKRPSERGNDFRRQETLAKLVNFQKFLNRHSRLRGNDEHSFLDSN
ncbi:hypothetical protein CRG49_008950 [Neisseria sp. N95_16]|nr:hypothetical protein CRG49_008950 [Neisseria sp. N95_16]PJO79325.1 hypothetical protein CWC45_00210 [Neisseria sp. N177_16]